MAIASKSSTKRARLAFNPNIHGLRGLAAFMVVLFHVYRGAITAGGGHISNGYSFWPTDIAYRIAGPILTTFDSGVDIFFMISGYLIVATLIQHQSIKKFAINRCLRIYPVFLAALFVMMTVGPIRGWGWMANLSVGEWFYHLFTNILFLPGFFKMEIALEVAWTLSYEAVFYILAATLFFVSGKISKTTLIMLIITLFIAILTKRREGIFFFMGVGVYFLRDYYPELKNKLIPYIPFLCFALFLFFSQIRDIYPDKIYILLEAAMGFIIFWYITEGVGLLAALMRNRFMQFLGTISYSLYIWHTIIMYVVKRFTLYVLPPDNIYLTLYVFAILSISFCILGSYISYKILEENIKSKVSAMSGFLQRYRVTRT